MRFLGTYYVMLFAAALSALPLVEIYAASDRKGAYSSSANGQTAECIVLTEAARQWGEREQKFRDAQQSATTNTPPKDEDAQSNGSKTSSGQGDAPAILTGAAEKTSTDGMSAESAKKAAEDAKVKREQTEKEAKNACEAAKQNHDGAHKASEGEKTPPPPPPPPKEDKKDEPKESPASSPTPSPSPTPQNTMGAAPSPSPVTVDTKSLTFTPPSTKTGSKSLTTEELMAANQGLLNLNNIPASLSPTTNTNANPNSYVATSRRATTPAAGTPKAGTGASGFGVSAPAEGAPQIASTGNSARTGSFGTVGVTSNHSVRAVTSGGNGANSNGTWSPNGQSQLLKSANGKAPGVGSVPLNQSQLTFAAETAKKPVPRGATKVYSVRSSYTGRGAQYSTVDMPRTLSRTMNSQYLARGSSPTLRIKLAPANAVATQAPAYTAPRPTFGSGTVTTSERMPASAAPSHTQYGQIR